MAVHTTQFAVREQSVGLLRPVLELASEIVTNQAEQPAARIAGVCGPTDQALREARLAANLHYDAILVQLGAF